MIALSIISSLSYPWVGGFLILRIVLTIDCHIVAKVFSQGITCLLTGFIVSLSKEKLNNFYLVVPLSKDEEGFVVMKYNRILGLPDLLKILYNSTEKG